MSDATTRHRSVWLASEPSASYSALAGAATADVAVIGGGITGLTTALLLQRAGKKVVVLEADRVGCGTTGNSTAKLTALHRNVYAQLEKDFGHEGARTYAQANQAGLLQIASLVEELAIDCQFERQAAYTYTCDESRVEELRGEAKAARRAGLPASFTTETELPFHIHGAVRVEDQAQFHPYRYCTALAAALTKAGGEIYETTRATDVTPGDPCRVETPQGDVAARHVVLATLIPFLDRGGFFAKTYPSRSYGISVDIHGEAPRGMYINVDSPTRSVRPLFDRRGLIVVGEHHKVGQDPNTQKRYVALEMWASQWFQVREVTHRWSSQDFMAVDHLPYIGRLPLAGEHMLVATGFNKWGLTGGTAAAMILSDFVLGKRNEWASLFDAARVDVLPSIKKLIAENADAAKHFFGDRLKSLSAPALDALPAGEGGIVDDNGRKIAAYRDDTGAVHACSPVCTHLGCYVQWNNAEKTWDCPCHGSRFDHEGHIVNGPAVRDLPYQGVAPGYGAEMESGVG